MLLLTVHFITKVKDNVFLLFCENILNLSHITSTLKLVVAVNNNYINKNIHTYMHIHPLYIFLKIVTQFDTSIWKICRLIWSKSKCFLSDINPWDIYMGQLLKMYKNNIWHYMGYYKEFLQTNLRILLIQWLNKHGITYIKYIENINH